jgi:hypothetical protein
MQKYNIFNNIEQWWQRCWAGEQSGAWAGNKNVMFPYSRAIQHQLF